MSNNKQEQKYTELTDELMFKLKYFKLNKGREETHSDSPTITTHQKWVRMMSLLWEKNHKYEDGKLYYNLITPQQILNYINQNE